MSEGHILVVDAAPRIRRAVRTALFAQGYKVTDVRGDHQMLHRLHSQDVDLVLVDTGLRGRAAIETCRGIRGSGFAMPIIVITWADCGQDELEALDAGANDFVVNPFEMAELLSRIQAALRKAGSSPAAQPERLRLGDIEIDFLARQVINGNGKVRLTPKEFDLLSYFASHANRTITHKELMSALWASADKRQCLRVIVERLRRKIERSPNHPQYLLTDPWFGYRMRLPR